MSTSERYYIAARMEQTAPAGGLRISRDTYQVVDAALTGLRAKLSALAASGTEPEQHLKQVSILFLHQHTQELWHET